MSASAGSGTPNYYGSSISDIATSRGGLDEADRELEQLTHTLFRETPEREQIVVAFPIVKDKMDIQGWSNAVYFAVQKAVYQLGLRTRDAARSAVTIDTGALKASIYVTSPASQADQQAGKPYGRAGELGKATRGYRKAVEASARKMGILDKGQTTAHLIDNYDMQGLYGSLTLRPTAEANKMGYNRGTMSHEYKGRLRALGERSFVRYEANEDVEHLPFTPMPLSSKEQFWVTVGASAYYAAYVEFGTVKQRAQPFLGPAVRDMERELQKVVKDAINSVGAKRSR